ncbi:MAG: leucyl aminopeptidase [Gemmatimonadetes bacterium]|nr:leucyl aminopeptidase [Gemmatimonadota bacterium]MYE15494.1 leucyl aminopeptidase [Gemmatimonadota bacterium]MYG23896.1 leucyl aminopeptidase [Gemmatimonadota bacterium]MYJ39772.1 leucyl aminopeptidase [Gemmatimonadota bacterium]
MRLETYTGAPDQVETPLLVVLVPDGGPFAELAPLSRATGDTLSQAVSLGDFQGRESDRFIGYRSGSRGPQRVLFAGVGSLEAMSRSRMRSAAGKAVRAAEDLRLQSLAICLSFLGSEVEASWVQAAAEGLVLASWRFDELRSPQAVGGDPEDRPPLVEFAHVVSPPSPSLERNVRVGHAFATGENRARTLQARPGNVATPSRLAAEAAGIADEVGLQLDVLGPAEMEAEAMGALLSVARGSDEEPRLIVLRHNGGDPGAPPLVLVGKGLTFDAGGISIKPAKGMEDMKYDMSGGAAVLGAMLAIGRLGVPANVVGVVPSSENLLNGSATKPGDVITSRSGKSIEVINTDAEGRLILADALDYAEGWDPAAIVDCATLTGACVIALGHHRSALLGNDQALLAELQQAGDNAGQPCWPLPLDGEYRKQLESDVADLKNVGGRPAGTITAACFLSEFVGNTPWAHLDIAGTSYGKTKKPYLRNGPNGTPCRLLLEWVRARARF